MGNKIASIHDHYQKHVPDIMGHPSADDKAAALERLANEVFAGATLADFKTPTGIVATRWDFERPIVLKQLRQQRTVAQTVSCPVSAAPSQTPSAFLLRVSFVTRPHLKTGNGDRVDVFDGGFVANNPRDLASGL